MNTNLLGLPEPLVVAVSTDDYDAGPGTWRSVTELIGPARAAALLHAYPDQIEIEDVADRIHLLMGKMIHKVLEVSGTSGIREQRLSATILGKQISGQFDHIDLVNGVLSDWKSTSVWTVVFAKKATGRSRFTDWEAQLNSYAYLAFLAGHSVTGLEAVVFLDGWSRRDAKRDAAYPQSKVVRIPFPLWDPETTLDFLCERVAEHLTAETQLQSGMDLLQCTAEERWADPPKKGPTIAKRCIPGRDGYCPMRSCCAARDDGQHAPGELGEA